MRHNDEKELFRKLSQGTISEEELGHLNKWMSKNGTEGLSKKMDEDWATFDQTVKPEGPPKWMIASKEKPATRVIPLWKKPWAVAASILLVLSLGMIFNWVNLGKPQLVNLKNTEHRKQLAILPDGSEVWLKRNSAITYQKPFSADKRVVGLEGEAFFEVKKDPTRPFIVQSDYLEIAVLGTAFNMITGTNNKIPEVALVEGSVNVTYNDGNVQPKSIRLVPGEKANLDVSNSEIITTSFLEERYEDAPYAWKDDVIIFQKADVYEVAQTLAEWYNISITVEPECPSGPLVRRVETYKYEIDQVLDGISRVMPYKFQQTGDESYIIKPN